MVVIVVDVSRVQFPSDLVLAEKWQMEKDLEWLCVRCHHNELGYATIQTLGGYIHTYKKTTL